MVRGAPELGLGSNGSIRLGNPFDSEAQIFDYALIEIPANAIIDQIHTAFVNNLLNRTQSPVNADLSIAPVEAPWGQSALLRVNGVDASDCDDLGFTPVGVAHTVAVPVPGITSTEAGDGFDATAEDDMILGRRGASAAGPRPSTTRPSSPGAVEITFAETTTGVNLRDKGPATLDASDFLFGL